MASKSYDEPDVLTTGTHRCYDDDGNQVSMTDVDYVTQRRLGHYRGLNTPEYHKRLRDGTLLPLNAYNRYDYLGVFPIGMGRTVFSDGARCDPQPNNVFSYRKLDPTLSVPWNPTLGTVDTNALLLAAMADVLPNLDILTSALELKKTVDMVVNVRKDAKDLIRQAMRGGFHTARAAANAWMAWRYGWRILYYDMRAVEEAIRTPIRQLVLTGQSGISDTGSETVVQDLSHSLGRTSRVTANLSYDRSTRARVLAKYKASTLNALMDIPNSTWELVPFSFVVDWFVNIGDILKAWKVKRSCDTLYASIGTKTTYRSVIYRESTSSGSCQEYFTSLHGSEILVRKTRVPASLPDFIPSLTVKLSSKHILDAAAICTTRIR